MKKSRRLAPEERRGLIATAAAGLVLKQGYLPIPYETLAAAAGVSRGLIYAYFPTQPQLFNAILADEFSRLVDAGLEAASRKADLADAALACSEIYFDHIVASGPIIHVILRDRLMKGQLARDTGGVRDRAFLRLARTARRALRLAARENIAAISLILTIPEEAGRLVWVGDLEVKSARQLMRRLVESSLAALTPPVS